ncbi:MAG: STAS/SEC14 domain-containing protein [Cyclobacteriaceae bacterium]|nr:STAS/SEC14 domain-containing protein [Cyclobacteriaceae bacterium]
MINIINQDDTDVLAIEVTEEITRDDYDMMVSAFERKLKKEERIKVYVEFESFDSIIPGVIREDLKFDTKHANYFSRIAVVGDLKWKDWMTKTILPFTSAEVRYFSRSDRVIAKRWLSETTEVKDL